MVSQLSSTLIRNAQLDDIHTLSSLLLYSFNHGLGEENHKWIQTLIRLSIQADLTYRIKAAKHSSHRQQCMVAVQSSERNRIIGTVELSTQHYNLWSSSKYLYVSNLAVHKDYRRQGIGYELLQHCEVLGKQWGLVDMYLHVRENNTAARQLYERCGYRVKRMDFNLGSLLLQQAQPLFLHKHLS